MPAQFAILPKPSHRQVVSCLLPLYAAREDLLRAPVNNPGCTFSQRDFPFRSIQALHVAESSLVRFIPAESIQFGDRGRPLTELPTKHTNLPTATSPHRLTVSVHRNWGNRLTNRLDA